MAAGTSAAFSEAEMWQRAIRLQDNLSPAGARALLSVGFADSDRRRIGELAAKARAGTLTPAEERQTDAYERLGCLLDIVHSQARRALKRGRKAS